MSPRVLRWVNGAFLILAIGFAAWFVASHRGDFGRLVRDADPLLLCSALLLLTAFVLLQGSLGAVLLRATGTEAPFREVLRLLLLSWLGKYVPGKVWVVTMRLGWLRRRSVPPEVVIAGSVVEHAFMLSTGAVVFLAASGGHPAVSPGLARGALALALAGVLVFVGSPGSVRRVLNWFLAVLRRPPVTRWPGRGQGAALFLGYCGTWAWAGLGIHLLAMSLTPGLGLDVWWPVTGMFALSVCAGFLAVVAPAGVGVREAVFVLGLEAHLPTAQAVFVAIAARLVFTAAELLAVSGFVGVPRLLAARSDQPEASS